MYHPQRFLRFLKVKVKSADRQKVLRTAAVLLVFFAVLGISPQKAERIVEVQEEQEEGEVQGVEGTETNNQQSAINHQQFIQRLPDSPPMASISAEAAYVIDGETESVLFEKNAHAKLPMASLTKIMTALVSLDLFSLEEIVTVPQACADIPPNEMGLTPLEKINVEGLLYGMLVNSGSDAACALSHHFKGDFVERMNRKAAALGLSDTHFVNETGLDGQNGDHYSTAKDLAKLSKEALKNGVFRKIVGTREANIPNADSTRWYALTSTNELLFTLPGITGIKTGYTQKARGCLTVAYERGGREIIAVILSSEDRFGEMGKILEILE